MTMSPRLQSAGTAPKRSSISWWGTCSVFIASNALWLSKLCVSGQRNVGPISAVTSCKATKTVNFTLSIDVSACKGWNSQFGSLIIHDRSTNRPARPTKLSRTPPTERTISVTASVTSVSMGRVNSIRSCRVACANLAQVGKAAIDSISKIHPNFGRKKRGLIINHDNPLLVTF